MDVTDFLMQLQRRDSNIRRLILGGRSMRELIRNTMTRFRKHDYEFIEIFSTPGEKFPWKRYGCKKCGTLSLNIGEELPNGRRCKGYSEEEV